jgi:hypothetical protein
MPNLDAVIRSISPRIGKLRYAVRSLSSPRAACAAARRATGTRYGLHDT